MPPLAPETPVSPVAQAPPDRPTTDLEQWARQGRALLFADRRLDQNEMRILRDFMEEVAMMAQSGGVGAGGARQPGMPPDGAMPQSPGEMNMNTQDMGTIEGATPREEQY